MEHDRIEQDELIGRRVTVLECTDPSWVDQTGVIVDETKRTFVIDNGTQHKRIAKKTATFAFDYQHTRTVVKGSRLAFRPEDRIKKTR